MLTKWFEGATEVIPAVDVLGTEAVRLRAGSYDDVVARERDPAELARAFARAGARRIHLVDLDADSADHLPVFEPLYSRSSIMTFVLSEVLLQALTLMNSPQQRGRRAHNGLGDEMTGGDV